ncbi:MAG: hypothetical protein WAO19_04800 [Candidatus Kryptoniota bacterium]
MKSRFIKEFLTVLFVATAFSACQKNTPVAVPQLQDFRDGSNLFSIKLPVGWPQSAQPAKVWVYNTQEAANKFFDPTSEGKPGVKIYVYADSAHTNSLEAVAQQVKDELRQEQAQIDSDVQTTLAGNPAVKIPYALKIDSKNTVYSYRVVTVADSMTYGYEAAGFNEDFNRYSDVFDSVELTYQIIPKAVAMQQQPEDLVPSQTFSSYQNDNFVIQYPSNFVATPKGASGDIITSVSIKGYRADCIIQVDVLDAKKLDVDKVFNQVKGNYPRSARSMKTKIDGLDAYQISYSPAKGIQSRAYFVVKNNKWIRVTLDWAESMQKDFLPAFEKAATSLKLK